MDIDLYSMTTITHVAEGSVIVSLKLHKYSPCKIPAHTQLDCGKMIKYVIHYVSMCINAMSNAKIWQNAKTKGKDV